MTLKLSLIVGTTVLVVFLANRLIDDAWPWRQLNPQERTYLDQGKAFGKVWPLLDSSTQAKIKDLLQKTSTS